MSSYNYISITVQYNSEKGCSIFMFWTEQGEPGPVAKDQSQAWKGSTKTARKVEYQSDY